MTLSELSVRRPVLAGVFSTLLLLAGIVGSLNLPVRELPDVDAPRVSVIVSYPGANAEVVENRITRPIEDQLSGISGIDSIRSSSEDAETRINVTFTLARDIESATNDVRDAVSRASRQLPASVDPPVVRKQDADARPIIWFSLSAPDRSIEALTDYAERFIVDRFSTLNGVAQVIVGGGRRYAMRIWLDQAAMAARGLTVADIESALERENVELPGGSIAAPDVDLTVRVERGYATAEAFARLPVARGADDDHIVRLGEVADVERAAAETRTLFRGNGETQVGIGIVRQSQANDLAVSEVVRAEAERLQSSLPEGMAFTLSNDSTVFVEESIRGVWQTLLAAAAIVITVIWLFLGSLRAVVIPAVVVPVCLVGTFAVLALAGFSINILTLLALVLSIGLVVDDAIVVLENIQRRLDLGEARTLAAIRGARQVFFAVIATTATVVATFIPLMFLPDTIGRVFIELAVTVVAAVVLSSFVALSLSPMMASKLLRTGSEEGVVARRVLRFVDRVRNGYCRLLERLMRYPWSVLPLMLVTIVVAALLYFAVPGELTPDEDRGTIFAFFSGPESAGYEYTREGALEIERILMEYVDSGEVDRAIVRVPGFDGYSTGLVFGSLAHWDRRERDGQTIVAEINDRLGELPGVRAFARMRGGLSSGVSGGELEFVLLGSNYEDLNEAADELIVYAQDTNPQLQRLGKDYEPTAPRLIVDIDRERAADLGVDIETIGRTLETHLGGRRVGYYVDRGESYDVILQNRPEARADTEDLDSLYVRGDGDSLVPLASLVTLEMRGEAFERNRLNRSRAIEVEATLADGYPLGDAVAWFEEYAATRLPPDMSYDFGGGAADFLKANQAALLAFAAALVVVYLTLAAQFESLLQPLVIMLSVPLAVAGGLLGLWLGGSSLNIYSQIGLIVLVGLAAKNGILLVDFANQRRDAGLGVREATLEAAETRFRPILMTGLSTAAGAVPLILATGPGAESRYSIGITIFSGLIIATLLTLLVVPVIYALIGHRTATPNTVARRVERERSAEQ